MYTVSEIFVLSDDASYLQVHYKSIFFSSRLVGVILCLAFLLMSVIVSGTLSSVNNYPIGVAGGGGDPR